jgi:hypothetical protein
LSSSIFVSEPDGFNHTGRSLRRARYADTVAAVR